MMQLSPSEGYSMSQFIHRIRNIAVLVLCSFGLFTQASFAAPISWTDWTSATATTASGTISGLTVGFTGNLNPSAQTSGVGTNYWASHSSTYTSIPEVDNAPPDSDIIRLTGGAGTGTQTLTFSAPVIDPVMAILSLGQPGIAVTYNFDTPVTVLNVGPGHFDNGGFGTLIASGNALTGNEGHGIIQFKGTFTSLSWTIPTGEFWHGFQIGITGVGAVPEPSTFLLLGTGVLGLIGYPRRRNQKQPVPELTELT